MFLAYHRERRETSLSVRSDTRTLVGEANAGGPWGRGPITVPQQREVSLPRDSMELGGLRSLWLTHT